MNSPRTNLVIGGFNHQPSFLFQRTDQFLILLKINPLCHIANYTLNLELQHVVLRHVMSYSRWKVVNYWQ